MNKKTIIIGSIISAIIVVGIIITCVFGFNFDLMYNSHKEIDIYIGQEFKNNEVKDIVKEVIGNKKVIIKKVELYEDMVSVVTKDITDEELQTLNTKINEKYGVENSVEDFSISNVAKIKITDLFRPYILGVSISFILIIIYLFIYIKIYQKLGKDIKIGKTIIGSIIAIIVVQLLYFSIIAITRIPVGIYTIPVAILLYIATIILKFKD